MCASRGSQAINFRGNITPWTQRVLELLIAAEAQTLTRDELIAKAGQLVPAGRAYRHVERTRKNAREHRVRMGIRPIRETDKRVVERSQDEIIASGRRAIINASLQTLKRNGYINPSVNEEGRKIISLAGCPTCGQRMFTGVPLPSEATGKRKERKTKKEVDTSIA